MNKSSIVVSGVISRISYKNINKGLVNFEIAKNTEYVTRDGFVNKETSFFSAFIDVNVLEMYKEIFKVGSKVVVKGLPRSYFDKDNKKCFCIKALEIIDERFYKEDNFVGPKISFDTDGVMIWNGKRCEVTPIAPYEEKELRTILAKYD